MIWWGHVETQTETYVTTDLTHGNRLLFVSAEPLSEQMLTHHIQLFSCSVVCAALGLNMLNVLYNSWSVSVLILYVICFMWFKCIKCVSYDSWSVSVFIQCVKCVLYDSRNVSMLIYIYIYMLCTSSNLSVLNMCYLPHGGLNALNVLYVISGLSVLNVSYASMGVSVLNRYSAWRHGQHWLR